MKLSERIIWASALTIAILFSLGGIYMITSNFQYLLQETISQNTASHILQTYSLESKLLKDIANEQDVNELEKNLLDYVNQSKRNQHIQTTEIAIRKEDQSFLYTTIPTPLLPKEDDLENYSIQEYQNQRYMMITSKIVAGPLSYHIIDKYDLTHVFQERNRQYQSFLLLDFGIILISFIVLNIISRYLTKPIKTLNEASKHIAQGAYEKRTNIQSDDEIGELSKSFDSMVGAIEQNIEQLELTIEQREMFMASFSHEIKTPMTAILGFSDMLRTGQIDDVSRIKAASFIYQESKRLENLSYSLMDLLSLDAHTQAFEVFSTDRLQRQIVQYYEHMQKDIQISCSLASAHICAHEALLFTLLRNLIENAIKAKPKDNQVFIQGAQEGHQYRISVTDHGCGIQEDQRKLIFEPFYMVDKSRARKAGGAGLGLSICKRIVQLHNSELQVESTYGVGTSISFSLEVVHNEKFI